MFRFYVDQKKDDKFILTESVLNHIKVARVKDKEFICIYKTNFYICKLENNYAKVISELKENHEFEEEVILAAGFINLKKFELLIQKATELGVTRLIPVITKNTSAKIPINISKKLVRWNEIIKNASEQSFRNKLMTIEEPKQFNEILKINLPNKYIAHEKYNSKVKESYPQNSIFLIGPEGGFTSEEIKSAEKKGFETISLGKRILRAETASMFVISKIRQ